MFWNTISPYFSNRSKKRSNTTLVDEKDKTLFEDKRLPVTYQEIFWGYRFKQRVLGREPSETQKDIVVIFKE